MTITLLNGQLVDIPPGVKTLPPGPYDPPGALPYQKGVGDDASPPGTRINSNPIEDDYGNSLGPEPQPRQPGPTPNSSTGQPYAEANPHGDGPAFEFAQSKGGPLIKTPNSSTGRPVQVAPRMATPSSSSGQPGFAPGTFGDPNVPWWMRNSPWGVAAAAGFAGIRNENEGVKGGQSLVDMKRSGYAPQAVMSPEEMYNAQRKPVLAPPGPPGPPIGAPPQPPYNPLSSALPPMTPQAAAPIPGPNLPANVPYPPERPKDRTPARSGGGGGRAAASPAPAPVDPGLGHYRASLGNARGQTWIPAGMDNPAPQIYRGPQTMGPTGQNYYIAGSAPMGPLAANGPVSAIPSGGGRSGGRGGGGGSSPSPSKFRAQVPGQAPGPMDPSIIARQKAGVKPGPSDPSIIARQKQRGGSRYADDFYGP